MNSTLVPLLNQTSTTYALVNATSTTYAVPYTGAAQKAVQPPGMSFVQTVLGILLPVLLWWGDDDPTLIGRAFL